MPVRLPATNVVLKYLIGKKVGKKWLKLWLVTKISADYFFYRLKFSNNFLFYCNFWLVSKISAGFYYCRLFLPIRKHFPQLRPPGQGALMTTTKNLSLPTTNYVLIHSSNFRNSIPSLGSSLSTTPPSYPSWMTVRKCPKWRMQEEVMLSGSSGLFQC